jgi:cellulose synthase/poly-beta-1,6-N-acetylglucosamine synthase-like glycosyltransferase
MNMRLVPQYGGTVGGIRKCALQSVGGWRGDALAEDTDATYRLLVAGWKTVYQNRSECYEQVPDSWTSRLRQIGRWARGHNQATARYSHQLLFNPRLRFLEKVDGLLLLGVYTMSPILVLGWMLGISLWYLGEWSAGLIIILCVTSYSTLGNFAIFFEVVAAAHLDGSRARIRLMPFIFLGFLVSLFSVTRATMSQVFPSFSRKDLFWHKTEHKNNHNNHHVNHKPNQHLEKYYNNHNNNHNNNPLGPGNHHRRRDE